MTCLVRSSRGHVAGGRAKVWGIPVGGLGGIHAVGTWSGVCSGLHPTTGASARSHFPAAPLPCSRYLFPEDAGKLWG